MMMLLAVQEEGQADTTYHIPSSNLLTSGEYQADEKDATPPTFKGNNCQVCNIIRTKTIGVLAVITVLVVSSLVMKTKKRGK